LQDTLLLKILYCGHLVSVEFRTALSSVYAMLSHSDIFSCWVASVAWSCLFAGVNAVKIFEILHERHVEVHMTQDQEELFVEHFMPHGITPKQFEKIENKARKFQIEKGDFLIRKGEDLDHVFLVVKGSTQAHILGRRLSAASTSRETKGDQRIGGDSGAWVGEMTFLERFGSKVKMSEQAKDSHLESRRQGLGISMYSIVAAEDCTVMSWSHSDLEELMEISTDLRAALTRAMTSSLVGKIVNLTLSRKEGMVNDWSGWLADWKHNDGASVQVRSLQKLILEEEEEEEEEEDGTETSGSLPADGEKLEELTASE
jgi:CRP-like cAMP-binding protein